MNAPYLRRPLTTRQIMLNVVIALSPACVSAVYYFGIKAFLLILTCSLTCVICEIFCKKANPLDLSALVTGILFALCLPSTVSLWSAAIGSAFAILIVKQLFGGIGKNFLNPALAARAFMMLLFPGQMTSFIEPETDAITSATALTKLNFEGHYNMFIGNEAGSIGETSVVMILLGFAYLVYKGTVRAEMPFIMIGATAVLTWILGGDAVGNVLSGGLLLGACFMATDYATTPCTVSGKWIFMLGTGIITALIRVYGAYPEGVCYAILIMNCISPVIEAATLPIPYATKKRGLI